MSQQLYIDDIDDEDDYIPYEIQLINDLPTASGSNAYYIYGTGTYADSSAVSNDDFVIALFVALGVIAGILLIGHRRFTR